MSIFKRASRADIARQQQFRRAHHLRAILAQRLRILRRVEHEETRSVRSRSRKYRRDEQTAIAIGYVEAAMAALTRVAYATASHQR